MFPAEIVFSDGHRPCPASGALCQDWQIYRGYNHRSMISRSINQTTNTTHNTFSPESGGM